MLTMIERTTLPRKKYRPRTNENVVKENSLIP